MDVSIGGDNIQHPRGTFQCITESTGEILQEKLMVCRFPVFKREAYRFRSYHGRKRGICNLVEDSVPPNSFNIEKEMQDLPFNAQNVMRYAVELQHNRTSMQQIPSLLSTRPRRGVISGSTGHPTCLHFRPPLIPRLLMGLISKIPGLFVFLPK
jgi:hypothetical protein